MRFSVSCDRRYLEQAGSGVPGSDTRNLGGGATTAIIAASWGRSVVRAFGAILGVAIAYL